MTKKSNLTKETLRLRVFAGPNGSGKSTIINSVKSYETENGIPIDFGIYINADDIAHSLRLKGCNFKSYQIKFNKDEFDRITLDSGLLNDNFSKELFKDSYSVVDTIIICKKLEFVEELAQIIANFLRFELLNKRKKFSFETVFSHQSKVDFMKLAKENGYKVYLYFVATENPEINVYRVKKVRVEQKGHDVPEEKIRNRYFRSMDLLFEASQLAYRSYYFDNSTNGKGYKLFANFKMTKEGVKNWEVPNSTDIPNWFKKYYLAKVKKSS